MRKIEYIKDTFEEYLSNESISASDIKNFMHSPKTYWHNKYGKKEAKEDQRHFLIGSALHEKILEPERFDGNYYVGKKVDKRTSEGKQAYQQMIEESAGRVVIMQDEYDMIMEMSEMAMRNKTFVELMKNKECEVSCYTKDEVTGLNVKVRPDILCLDKSTIVDLKTCLDSSKQKFRNDVYSYGYNVSAAYYLDFLNKENYVFAALEKQKPYQFSLYELDDEFIEVGRLKYRKALDLMKWSYDNDYWCDYNEFEVLMECYDIGNLETFFDMINNGVTISIINK